jgi:hypothetical protein
MRGLVMVDGTNKVKTLRVAVAVVLNMTMMTRVMRWRVMVSCRGLRWRWW